MLKRVMLVADESFRKFCDTVLDFTEAVYSGWYLPELVVVTTPREVEGALESLKRELPTKKTLHDVFKRYFIYDECVGFASPEDGGFVILCLRPYDPKFLSFAYAEHEFAHHATRSYKVALSQVLAWDIPSLEPFVGRLTEVILKAGALDGLTELGLRMAIDTLVGFGWEFTADYIAWNYFVLRNTGPHVHPHALYKALEEIGVRAITMTALDKMSEYLEAIIKGAKISEGARSELLKEVEAIRGAFVREGLPRSRRAIHGLVSTEAFKAWPKDVYFKDKDRYGVLFEGLPEEELKKRGIPIEA
jgi:hypothetical protein